MSREVIIVTGATSGIGYALVRALFQRGVDEILALGRRTEVLEKSDRLKSYSLDLSKSCEIDVFIRLLKEKDILIKGFVHCAGLSPITRMGEFDYKTIVDTYAVNTFSFLYICSELWKYGLLKDAASIVALSSIVAERTNYSQCVYGSSKCALNYIVENLARVFLKKKIRVNALELGCVDTPMYQSLQQTEEQLRKYAFGPIPLETITNEVMRLLSNETAHVTGSILKIDSGFLVNK